MYHKTRLYRRNTRRNAIARKKKLDCHVNYVPEHYYDNPRILGTLHKGKIHCSCCLCAAKTKKYAGVRNRSINSWTISDRRKLTSIKYSLQEYLESA